MREYNNGILFIDTETGGLDPRIHSLLSIGLVAWRDGNILKSTEIFIKNAEYTLTPGALNINGIDIVSMQKKDNAYYPNNARRHMRKFMSDNGFDTNKVTTLGGHNTWFDVSFIDRILSIGERDALFSHRYVDTASLLIAYLDKKSKGERLFNPSIYEAARYFGIKTFREHTAECDAILAAKLYNRMLEEI